MPTFGRAFPIDQINDQVLEQNPWFEDMLRYWRPAGDALHRDMAEVNELVSSGQMPEEDPTRLRLAIRNGYFNLYRGGQSVAKVAFGGDGGLQARIHNKYVRGDKGIGKAYIILTSAALPDRETGRLRQYRGIADVRSWVSNANKHVGNEKRFVDLVVARNPDTIDLEMALPAYSLDRKERNAPRMDLVALEPAGDRWQIVFWEAKLAQDGRARCRGDDVYPKVVYQLAQYTRWLHYANNRQVVAAAYQKTCRLLVAFHGLAKRVNPGIEELGPGIVSASTADTPSLLVDDRPRLLIDDRGGNIAFTKNGHLKKLRDKPCGIHVQMVSGLRAHFKTQLGAFSNKSTRSPG
jgi:hypothetical protein